MKKIVSQASKTWKKESINCLERCEKSFMDERIIKLYSKINCGLMPDILRKKLHCAYHMIIPFIGLWRMEIASR